MVRLRDILNTIKLDKTSKSKIWFIVYNEELKNLFTMTKHVDYNNLAFSFSLTLEVFIISLFIHLHCLLEVF